MIRLEIFPDGAVYDHGEIDAAGSLELDALLEQRERGRIAPTRYLSTLRGIVTHHPHYIDGHAHLGAALFEQGKPKLALAACLTGFELGKSAIPEDFGGEIRWGYLQNRPFLRVAQGAALAYAALGKHAEAVKVMEAMLRWNPDDHQGMRFILGSSQLRAGDVEAARQTFTAYADSYPPCHYERGLLEFAEGHFVAAATSLRRGFAENCYIAEILAGNPDPMTLPVWHGTNFAGTELAQEYVAMAEPLWRRTPDAFVFLRWLYAQPAVLRARADSLSLREQLAWEDDHLSRKRLLDELGAAYDAVDDGLSAQLVIRREHPQFGPIWPWELPIAAVSG